MTAPSLQTFECSKDLSPNYWRPMSARAAQEAAELFVSNGWDYTETVYTVYVRKPGAERATEYTVEVEMSPFFHARREGSEDTWLVQPPPSEPHVMRR